MSDHAFDRYTNSVYALNQAADQLHKARELVRRIGKTLQDNPESLFSTGGDASEIAELAHHWPNSERLRELLDVFQNAQETEERAWIALGHAQSLIQRPPDARQ